MADNSQNIQWFPGHMTRALRDMQAIMPLIDAVVEICDARSPVSSRNPVLNNAEFKKPRLLILNKSDLSDPDINLEWDKYYKTTGQNALFVNAKDGRGINRFPDAVRSLLAERISCLKQKGMDGKPLRVMVVGIPNVGKSSFINKAVKKTAAAVADRPGVTRGNQWFSVDRGLELLDTPGVLPPKFSDPVAGLHAAFCGCVRDEVTDIEDLGFRLCELLSASYPDALAARYGIDKSAPALEIFEQIGRARGKLIKGGEVDYERTAAVVLDEFRAGKIGRISLEAPKEKI